jgi:branched-chain amino acid transport system permease protein
MRKLLPFLCVLLLACIPLALTNQYYLNVLIMMGIFTIGAMSLNLLLGYAGQLSLGHVAFFGIGAYTDALLSLGFDLHFGDSAVVVDPKPAWLAFIGGILVAALFGWFVGRLSFRVRGAYFVIVTISFAEVMRIIAVNWVDLTQGPMALNNIPSLAYSIPVPWATSVPLQHRISNYYLVLFVALVAFIIIQRLVQSGLGRAMIAFRENEPLAKSVGINVTRYLVLAAVTSAAIAGAAGCLYAQYVRIVDPDVFLFIYTVTMVIMVISGGKGTLAGPIVGGIIFSIVPELLRGQSVPQVQWIVYGALMILIVYFLPEGIMPAVQHLVSAGRKARHAALPQNAEMRPGE